MAVTGVWLFARWLSLALVCPQLRSSDVLRLFQATASHKGAALQARAPLRAARPKLGTGVASPACLGLLVLKYRLVDGLRTSCAAMQTGGSRPGPECSQREGADAQPCVAANVTRTPTAHSAGSIGRRPYLLWRWTCAYRPSPGLLGPVSPPKTGTRADGRTPAPTARISGNPGQHLPWLSA